MTRALLTGGSGFVGANLVRKLLDEGHEVDLLMRPDFAKWRLEGIEDAVRVHQVDIANRDAVRQVIQRAQPQWVFHLAAYGAYPTEESLEQMLHTNVLGTAALLSAAMSVGVDAFVNAGSSSEYGFKDHAPKETEWLEPNSDYAVTKASSTLLCRHAGRQSGGNIVTLRLYSAYGPWERPSRLIPRLAIRGIEGGFPNLVSPATARDFIHVRDVVAAFLLAARHPSPVPGAIYNIGTGVQTSMADVVEIVREEFNLDAEPVWGSMDPRSWDTAVWVADSGAARVSLGWEPRWSLREGFRDFVDWLRSDEPRLERYRNHGAT